MFKSDEEINDLLGHKNNGQVKIIGQGQDDRSNRKNSGKLEHLDLEARARIGTLASIIGVKSTSELVDKTPGMVSRLKNGKNGIGVPDQELERELLSKKGQIQEQALSKAQMFLEMLGIQGDLSDEYKKASIAEKVVSIYEKLSPKNPNITDNRTQIVFYAPKIKESSAYPVIEVETQNG